MSAGLTYQRATEMKLTAREVEILVSYLCGADPDVVNRALDYIQRQRDAR